MSVDKLNHNEKIVDLVRTADSFNASEDLVSFADHNDVSVPVLAELETQDMTQQLSERSADVRQEHRQYLSDLLGIDELFDAHDIEYVAIKSRMLHDIQPWDLNVLVAPEDWERATMLLRERGWRRSRLFEHPLARTEPGKQLYKHEDRFPVHLHRHVSWNGVTYIPAQTVLANKTRSNGVVYPSWEMDTLIHCAHSVFENYELTLAEAYQITHVFDADGEMRAIARQNGWEQGYELTVSTANQVMSEIDTRTKIELPVAYSKRDLLRAWTGHAKTDSPHQLLLHGGLFLLK